MTTIERIKPPRTIMEVFTSLPEGTMAQLIENNIIMSPSPLDIHQLISIRLSSKLLQFVESKKIGTVREAPYDVYLDDQNVFQPDILYISNKNLNLIKRKGLFGIPDLVIEILSPSNSKYDLIQKKNVYERTGVNELWIIDPESLTFTGFHLVQGEYLEFYKGHKKLESKLLKFKFVFKL